jgi:hypothetical protein
MITARFSGNEMLGGKHDTIAVHDGHAAVGEIFAAQFLCPRCNPDLRSLAGVKAGSIATEPIPSRVAALNVA